MTSQSKYPSVPASARRAGRQRSRMRAERGQVLILGALMMVVLVGFAGLAVDSSQDRASGVMTQALADAASTSAATFWAGENPTTKPATADGVGPRAAAIAAVNGLPVAVGNRCVLTSLTTYDVTYYDAATSGAPSCGAPSGWKSSVEVRIPPVPLPAKCTPAYSCVQVIASRKVRNSVMAVMGQSTTTVTMQSVAQIAPPACSIVASTIANRQMGSYVAGIAPPATLTLPVAATAGDLLVASLKTDAAGGFTAPAGWVMAATQASGTRTAQIWYYPNVPAGIISVAFTSPGATSWVGGLTEWSGVASSGALDQVAMATTPNSSSTTVTTTPLATAGELAIADYATIGGVVAPTPSAGWTAIGANVPQHGSSDYQLVAGTAAVTESPTNPANLTWADVVATFKPGLICAGGGPGGAAQAGIISLGTNNLHNVYGEGTGTFRVNGDLFVNNPTAGNAGGGEVCYPAGGGPADAEYDQTPPFPPCPNASDIKAFMNDAFDVYGTGNAVITGTLTGVVDPLDGAYLLTGPPPTVPNNCAGCQYNDPGYPAYEERSSGEGNIWYGNMVRGASVLTADPVAAALGAPPNGGVSCGAVPAPTFTDPATGGNGPPPSGPFSPGVYTYSVTVAGGPPGQNKAGSPTFLDCGGSPGIYVFQKGVYIAPAANKQVYGDDVVFLTQRPLNNCGTLTGNSGDGSPNTPNFTVGMGGAGSITLSGANSGPYKSMLLWQESKDGALADVEGNFGFNSCNANDSATISLTGTVYNTTLGHGSNGVGQTDQMNYSPNYQPYTRGGLLVSAQSQGPATNAAGSLSITGQAIVDTFASEGNGNLVVTYNATDSLGIAGGASGSPATSLKSVLIQ